MQTKPLINCADNKGIMIKLMLCVIAVLSLTMFIPQKVEASSCSHCTCDPNGNYAGDRAWWSEGNYSWACGSREEGDACEYHCGGHEYPKGPGTTNDIATLYGWAHIYEEWDYDKNFACYHSRWKHFKFYSKCSLCGQLVGDEREILLNEWDDHNLQGMEDYRRDAADPCKVVKHGEVWCTVCGGRFEVNEFAYWSHLNYGSGFNQTHPDMTNIVSVVDCDKEHRPDIYAASSQGDSQGQGPVNEDAHAVWCQTHGYVNIENVEEGSRPELGNYIGDKTNFCTPLWLRADLSVRPNMWWSSDSLHLYDHDMEVISESGSIVTEKCKYCEHVEEYDLNNVILSSRRTDNDHPLGWSDLKRSKIIDGDYQNSTVWFEHKIKDVDSGSTWYNHTGEWDLIIDGSLGPNRILSQDGTHTVASREHYDRYTEKIHNKGTDDEWSEWVLKQKNVTKTTKSHRVRIDTTEPKTNVNVQVGSYKNPITKLINSDGTYNSLGYGLKITLDSDDRNSKAKQGQNDVSKLFVAYLEIWDKDDPSNVKYYDLSESIGNGKRRYDTGTEGYGLKWMGNKYNINTTNMIDLNDDFKYTMDFDYKVHVMDCAGNEYIKEGSIERQPEIFTSIKNITHNKNFKGTNNFLGGEHGVLTIITTGWVDETDLEWNSDTLAASQYDSGLGYPVMDYNQLLSMVPNGTASGFNKDGTYVYLEENNCYSPDRPETEFTRIYEFVFWAPFSHDYTTDSDRQPFANNANKYPVEATAYNDKYNREAKSTTLYHMNMANGKVDGQITDKFRSSLLF